MWNIYLLCNRNVSSNMETQWGLIASEHSTHVSKQWKYWNWDTVRKESTTVLSCLGHLLLEKEKDILFLLLSLSGMLQTAKSLQKSWALAPKCKKNTVLSQKKSVCNSFSSTDSHHLCSAEWRTLEKKELQRYQYKIYPKKYIFSNFSKCFIFIKNFIMWYHIYLPE